MTDSAIPFVSELIRAANEVEKLTKPERAALLRRAAATIRDNREQIAYSETPANDTGPGEVAHDLSEMARLIELFSSAEVSAAMLRGAETIRTGAILLDIKREIQDER